MTGMKHGDTTTTKTAEINSGILRLSAPTRWRGPQSSFSTTLTSNLTSVTTAFWTACLHSLIISVDTVFLVLSEFTDARCSFSQLWFHLVKLCSFWKCLWFTHTHTYWQLATQNAWHSIWCVWRISLHYSRHSNIQAKAHDSQAQREAPEARSTWAHMYSEKSLCVVYQMREKGRENDKILLIRSDNGCIIGLHTQNEVMEKEPWWMITH